MFVELDFGTFLPSGALEMQFGKGKRLVVLIKIKVLISFVVLSSLKVCVFYRIKDFKEGLN